MTIQLLAMMLANLWGAAPTVHLPVVTPAVVPGGVNTTIAIAARILAPEAQPVLTATVWRTDAAGNLLAVAGEANDTGRDGDLQAADHRYTWSMSLLDTAPGVRYFRVAATFSGVRTPVLSPVAALETMAAGVPTEAVAPKVARTVVDPTSGAAVACDGISVFHPLGLDFALVKSVAERVNGKVTGVQAFSQMNAWNVEIPCTDWNGLAVALRTVNGAPNVLGSEPEALSDMLGVPVNDPKNQTGNTFAFWYTKVGLDKAWMITMGDRSFRPKIAVVDSGVNYNHEDLKSKVIKGKDFVGVNDNDPMDELFHGTAVAGLAGAATNNGLGVVGAAPENMLIAIRIGNLHPTITHQAKGIRNAIELGADVVNLSVGGPFRSERLASAVHDAYHAGALVVAAVGNDNENKKFYPAAFDDREIFAGLFQTKVYDTHVLAVGGVDQLMAHWVASDGGGSNYGSWVDIMAPATGVVTTCLASAEFCDFSIYSVRLQGTSLSAPIVSGAAALVWSTRFALSNDEVRDLLIQKAVLTGTTDPGGRPIRLLNAFASTAAAAANTCPNCGGTMMQEVVPAPFPSTGFQVRLGFRASTAFPTAATQLVGVHGVAISLRPQANITAKVLTNLVSCDTYAPNAFFDLFAMTMSAGPYWATMLFDDVRPVLNSFFTAVRTGSRVLTGACPQVSTSPQDLSNGITISTAGRSVLNVVLDTRALPFADNLAPSYGVVTVEDLTPQ